MAHRRPPTPPTSPYDLLVFFFPKAAASMLENYRKLGTENRGKGIGIIGGGKCKPVAVTRDEVPPSVYVLGRHYFESLLEKMI